MNTSKKPTLNEAECGNKSKPLLQAVFLAPYLPYNLRYCQRKESFKDFSVSFFERGIISTKGNVINNVLEIDYYFPILKPMSDLTVKFINEDVVLRDFQPQFIIGNRYEWSYGFVQRLFELHFDYFSLIQKGLAYSIHDVV
jgi:hypothetical protein